MRIVFMGTPEFAVPSLRILHESSHTIAGVVTAVDKLGGRGGKQKLESAVKQYAVSEDIPLLQPPNLKDAGFLDDLRALKADLQVVVAFRMLPRVVWDMPPIGTINLHGSLLPAYRGAAPIHRAIMNGETKTGVTTFFLKHEIDTGDILLQRTLPIGPNDNVGDVHDRMMEVGAQVVLESVNAIARGDYLLKPQEESLASPAPKIYHETCAISFNRPAAEVHNFVRGLSPFPASWTTLGGDRLKILETHCEMIPHDYEPGTLVSDGKTVLKYACTDGFLHVTSLQLQGRKRMSTRDFLNGYDILPYASIV
jgi:methionyl-tRNA formyltransferase